MTLDTSTTRPAVHRDGGWKSLMLAHGGGGQLTDQLLDQSILPRLHNLALDELLDSATFDPADQRVALTIDSYVVQPLRFPGGDIGRLCVSGTVNDLAVCGATPAGIALSFILAEGLERALFDEIMNSIASTAAEANVNIVTGDTKVVGRAQADGMYVTTAGVGLVPRGRQLHPRRVKAGDVLIINGPIADHGLAVMLAREMPDMHSALRSDVAPLNGLIAQLLGAVPDVVFMRDATRGGLAGLAADLAQRTKLHVVLDEARIPIRPETLHAAELLGIDPLDVANEGKVVIVVREADAAAALSALRTHPLGKEADIIGLIDASADGLCELRTTIGGRRIVQKPYGEQLPRIC
jgi:hydrogenase expression/formation protein HypE